MREIWISLGVVGLFLSIFIIVQLVSNPSKATLQEDLSIAPSSSEEVVASSNAATSETTSETTSPSQEEAETVLTTPSGLQYVELEEGTGASPEKGNVISVHYKGTLEDGTKFDSSYDRSQPLQFQLGVGQVIQGWDEGLSTMKVGGKRKLIIPPTLGYGSQAVGPIPPNSTLIFEVELVDIVR